MQDQNILVVGAAGYVGSHCAKLLVKRRNRVIVLDDLSTGHREAVIRFCRDGDFFEGTYADGALVQKICRDFKIKAVFHFGAKALVGESVEDPMLYYRANVADTITLLKGAIAGGVKHFVFSSTCATFGIPDEMPMHERLMQKPLNPYGWSKFFVERILHDFHKAYGLNSAILRYFNAAGADPEGDLGEDHRPETHLIPKVIASVLKGEKLVVNGDDYETPDGTCVRDYVHVNDLGAAHILALNHLEKSGGVLDFNLGSEKGYSNLEIIRAVEKAVGKEITYTLGPRRAGDAPKLVADSTKAKTILGWKAEFDLEAIIRTTHHFLLTHPHGFSSEDHS